MSFYVHANLNFSREKTKDIEPIQWVTSDINKKRKYTFHEKKKMGKTKAIPHIAFVF